MKRKSLVAATLASAIAVLAVACGSDPNSGPAASDDSLDTTPGASEPMGSIGIPEPDGSAPAGIVVGEPVGVVSYLDLVDALESRGVESAASDMVFPPTYFAVDGRSIVVGGNQDSQVPAIVFEFEDVATRLAAQATIDLKAGVIGELSLGVFDRVVFFGSGNLILMYTGDDAETIDLLSSILGQPLDARSDSDVADPSVTIRKLVDAPIESVDLVIMESDPVQITVEIVARLSNGCQEPGGVVSHNAGNIFGLTVSNSVPALDGIACTDDLRVYEESVLIGSRNVGEEFRPGVIYTLVVNDVVIEFTTNGVQDEKVSLSGYDALMLALTRQGVTPHATGEIVSGVLGVEAGIIKLGDADIQVHEFKTAALPVGMASGVSSDGGALKLPDGSTVSVRWIGPPHFFLIDNVIALYIGEDATVLSALLGVAGESFAGSPIDAAKPSLEPTKSPGDEPVPFPIPTQRAPIESVEIAFLESFPVQHMLQIMAGLENSCIEPYGSEAVLTTGADGINVVKVEVTNVVSPLGMACDEMYRIYEENINLGSDFEIGSEWDVFVNGELETSFTAQ
ncbi:MAG: hypothetical protein QF554_08050 [Dehalococcoidia bacterium]|jgi:hypothetical protein|nr:hypothetical protein [Dehalococcoidia bacterium]